MPHPKARTKPRPRAARRPTDRIILTAKGRAILAALDQLRGVNIIHAARVCNFDEYAGRATPCAPNRGNSAPAALPAHNAGTAGAPPAHPAGKSDAAAIAPDKEPNP